MRVIDLKIPHPSPLPRGEGRNKNMPKLLSAVLITFFALSSVSAVPFPVSKNPKTCCGRSICMCTHVKGEQCPFKHGEEKAAKQDKPSCHLNSKMKTDHHANQTVKIPESTSRFRAAPCHSSNPESTAPNAAKDFFADARTPLFEILTSEPFKPSSNLFPSSIFSEKIKHPPRTLLF